MLHRRKQGENLAFFDGKNIGGEVYPERQSKGLRYAPHQAENQGESLGFLFMKNTKLACVYAGNEEKGTELFN